MKQIEKRVLTFEEGCEYLGYAKSTVYKMTSGGILPFSKPNRGSIFFDRVRLEEWMLSNASSSLQEKKIESSTFITTHK